jgi:phage tail protein X
LDSVPQQVDRRGSGRIRHEEKITVYVSADELLALEQARLTLRARHGMAVDRGRIVREAIAAMLADLAASADDSELVRRLSTS